MRLGVVTTYTIPDNLDQEACLQRAFHICEVYDWICPHCRRMIAKKKDMARHLKKHCVCGGLHRDKESRTNCRKYQEYMRGREEFLQRTRLIQEELSQPSVIEELVVV